MKRVFNILVAVVVVLCAVLPASAASKKNSQVVTVSSIVEQVFKADIDCDDCVKKVMNTLPSKKGVKDVEVSLRDKLITVKYDRDKTSDSNIIKALSKIKIAAQVYKPVLQQQVVLQQSQPQQQVVVQQQTQTQTQTQKR